MSPKHSRPPTTIDQDSHSMYIQTSIFICIHQILHKLINMFIRASTITNCFPSQLLPFACIPSYLFTSFTLHHNLQTTDKFLLPNNSIIILLGPQSHLPDFIQKFGIRQLISPLWQTQHRNTKAKAFKGGIPATMSHKATSGLVSQQFKLVAPCHNQTLIFY
ncbi:hypothetical protein V8G54_016537 [Vigna mungo]|uniref:Uncharacterized protein n=1 Tax=Vigna mungo TaxID=3915 RepID=A0AAQ3NP30_VIGMU